VKQAKQKAAMGRPRPVDYFLPSAAVQKIAKVLRIAIEKSFALDELDEHHAIEYDRRIPFAIRFLRDASNGLNQCGALLLKQIEESPRDALGVDACATARARGVRRELIFPASSCKPAAGSLFRSRLLRSDGGAWVAVAWYSSKILASVGKRFDGSHARHPTTLSGVVTPAAKGFGMECIVIFQAEARPGLIIRRRIQIAGNKKKLGRNNATAPAHNGWISHQQDMDNPKMHAAHFGEASDGRQARHFKGAKVAAISASRVSPDTWIHGLVGKGTP